MSWGGRFASMYATSDVYVSVLSPSRSGMEPPGKVVCDGEEVGRF